MSSNYEELLKQQETILSQAKSESASGKPKNKSKTPPAAPLDKKKVKKVNGRATKKLVKPRLLQGQIPTKALNYQSQRQVLMTLKFPVCPKQKMWQPKPICLRKQRNKVRSFEAAVNSQAVDDLQVKKAQSDAGRSNNTKPLADSGSSKNKVEQHHQAKQEEKAGGSKQAAESLVSLQLEFQQPSRVDEQKLDTLGVIQDYNKLQKKTTVNSGNQVDKKPEPSVAKKEGKTDQKSVIAKETDLGSKLQSQSQPVLSPQKRDFQDNIGKIKNGKNSGGDSGQDPKMVDKTEAKEDRESRLIADTPEIRLTSVKKEDYDEDFDPFQLDNELAILQKIIAERTVREGEIRL